MNEFKTFHPLVNFMYFAAVIAFCMCIMHPICLIISLLCSLVYMFLLKGRGAVRLIFTFLLPITIITALINPMFSHEGMTIITYLPSGNPITLESIIYGLASAVMLCTIISWFACYNEVVTSDKFIYLFGKIIPSLSLVISMTLRFVPNFKTQIKAVYAAQKGLGNNFAEEKISGKIRIAVSVLSIMTTWALEGAIDTANSMKNRGYGLSKRSSFSIFVFRKRDWYCILLMLILIIYITVEFVNGSVRFAFYPVLEFTVHNISVFVAYFIFCSIPIMIEIEENIRWKYLKSRI